MSDWIVKLTDGKAREALSGAVDEAALDALKSLGIPADVAGVLREAVEADKPFKALAEGLSELDDYEQASWFLAMKSLEVRESAEGRTLGWPDLKASREITPEGLTDELTLTVAGKGGLAFLIDAEGDEGKDDVGTGTSGRFVVTGELKLDLKASHALAVGDASAAISITASRLARERVEWRFTLANPDQSAIVTAGQIARRVAVRPSDFAGCVGVLDSREDGVTIEAIALQRVRKAAAGASLKLPFKLNVADITVTGSFKTDTANESELVITRAEGGLRAALKGSKILTQQNTLGLKISAGLSGLPVDQLKRLTGVLEEGGEILKAIDEAFDETGSLTLLKPGGALAERIKEKIGAAIDTAELKAYLADRLGVEVGKAQDALSEFIADTLDDELDFLDSEAAATLSTKIRDAVGLEKLEDTITEVVDDAVKTIDGEVEKLATKVAEGADTLVSKALRIGPEGKANIGAIRGYLKEARSLLSGILKAAGDDAELAISVEFSRTWTKSKSQTSLAALEFKPAAADHFRALVRNPNAFAGTILATHDIPSGVALVDGSLKKSVSETLERTLNIQVGDMSFSSTAKAFNAVEWTLDRNGITATGKGGASSAATLFGDTREVQISYIGSYAASRGAPAAVSAEGDGIALKMSHSEGKDLSAKMAGALLDNLVETGVIEDGQRIDMLADLRSARAASGKKKIPGDLTVDLILTEYASDKLLAAATRADFDLRAVALPAFFFADSLFREKLEDVFGVDEDASAAALARFYERAETQDELDELRRNRLFGIRKPAETLLDINEVTGLLGEAFAGAGRLMGQSVDEAGVRAANKRFADLGTYLRPATLNESTGSYTTAMMAIFHRLARPYGAGQVQTVLSYRLEGGEWRRFIALGE